MLCRRDTQRSQGCAAGVGEQNRLLRTLATSLLLRNWNKRLLAQRSRKTQRKRRSQLTHCSKTIRQDSSSWLLLRIDAHVIHEHLLRELGCVIGRAGPISANRNIQDEEKRMIEHPSAARRPLRGIERGV